MSCPRELRRARLKRFGSGETEIEEFGVKEPPERKEKPFARFECFEQPKTSRNGSELCFIERQETDAEHQPKPNIVLKRGNKMTLNLPAPGSWGGEMNDKHGAIIQHRGNSCEAVEIQTNPVYNYSEEVILIEERHWNDIPACQQLRGKNFEAEVSKLGMRWARHYDQHERETDGAVHWKSMGPKLRTAFLKAGEQKFSDSDWLQYINKGCNNTRYQCCKNSRDVLLYIRAIQGHTGGT